MPDLQEIDVVILAGGFGTRLQPIVSDRPKVLAEVSGRPFIYYLLDQLCETGIKRVVLCTGYMGDYVEEAIGQTKGSSIFVFSRENDPLGTGGALKNAIGMINTDWILVLNGDSFVDVNYQDFVSWHSSKMSKLSIIVASIGIPDRYGVVELNRDQQIISFSEKGPVTIKGTAYINAGVYLMHRSVIEKLPSKETISLENEVFPSLIRAGIFGYVNSGPFIDIGTPESFRSAEIFFSERKAKKSTRAILDLGD